MENGHLKILIVEDLETDAALLVHEFQQAGYSVGQQRVETAADFVAALQQQAWDAVISDYVLPQFSGPQALKLLHHSGQDIPFLMVSGVHGEDHAVAMMQAGADDYILKGKLSRLVPALERELAAAADRRRQKRAEGAMQYLAAIVESSEDAIYGNTLDSIIVSWNPAAERLFGYCAEEIIGHSIAALFPLKRRDELLDIFATIRRGEILGILETERLHKNGRIIPVSVTVSPIMDATGGIIGASAIVRDITKQKQAEHERQLLIEELTATVQHVKTLSGMLPICAGCKRIRDDQGYWQQVEAYLSKRSDLVFSHGICPKCAEDYKQHLDRPARVNPGGGATR